MKADKTAENIGENRKMYNNLISNRILIISIILAGLIILFLFNISIGSSSLSVGQILRALFLNEGEGNNVMIVKDVRLPMALMAIVVGAALGIGGCEIQTILGNPIACPYNLGISSAVSFGAAVGLILNNSMLNLGKTLAVTGNAFLFILIV